MESIANFCPDAPDTGRTRELLPLRTRRTDTKSSLRYNRQKLFERALLRSGDFYGSRKLSKVAEHSKSDKV
jgi:hypothetical protein